MARNQIQGKNGNILEPNSDGSVNVSQKGSKVLGDFLSNEIIIEEKNNWDDTNDYKSFPNFEENQKTGEIYLVYRSGEAHMSLDGKIMLSKSTDGGTTWSDSVAIQTPPSGWDYRDPRIMYDKISDSWFLTFHDYDGNTHNHYIKKADNPEGTWIDVTPTSVFDTISVVCHKVVRITDTLYLPVYGKDSSDTDYQLGLYKSTDGGTTWTTNDLNIKGSEVAFYWKYTGENVNPIALYFIKRNSIGEIYKSTDFGTTWGKVSSVGYYVSGGPYVKNMGNYFMIIARNDIDSRVGCISYSIDGEEWTKPFTIASNGNMYGDILINEYGKCLLLYDQEGNGKSKLVIRKLKSINLNEINELLDKTKIKYENKSISTTVTAGGSETVEIIPKKGWIGKIQNIRIFVPEISSVTTGTQMIKFFIKSETNLIGQYFNADGTGKIIIISTISLEADTAYPATSSELFKRIDKSIFTNTEPFKILYQNDTDQDQTGKIIIEVVWNEQKDKIR
jgi:hypothetical protein